MFRLHIIKYQNTIFYPVKEILQIPYYELTKVEAIVKIYINNILFFSDDYFPILEFIYQFEQWKNSQINTDFEYNSIEAVENPIISFHLRSGKCIFNSIWKLTSELLSVELSEVIEEINSCKIELLTMINTKK